DDPCVGSGCHARLEQLARLPARMVLVDAGELAHDLPDRPERDSLAVGKTSPSHDARARADPRDQLGSEPGLADAGLAGDRDEPARAVRDDALELALEDLQLLLAPRERRRRPARDESHLARSEQPVGRDRLGLPLDLQRLDALGVDRAMDQLVRTLAEQHLAGTRGLLEPRGDVDGVAGDERLAARRVSRHDFARVDADAQRDPPSELSLEPLVQRRQPRLHLDRGATRPQRVVLVRLGYAEHGEDRVADELLDRAAVALERSAHLAE